MRPHGTGPTFRTTRVVHVPRGAALLLAIPVMLALGVAGILVFLAGLAGIMLAPLLRRRPGQTRSDGEEHETIILDRAAYHTVGPAGEDAAPAITSSRDAPTCSRR